LVDTVTDAPLKGLKVIELARILAGPWIGQTLADLGAEVIKIEAPEGDDTRQWGPPFLKRPLPEGGTETVAAYFHAANRGKQSVTCDFKDPDDLVALKAMIADADVLVENFKVGGLAKFGLDYVGVAWIDIFTGLYGVIGIQAALAERNTSGIGQRVDLSLLDCGVGVLANQATNFLLGGASPTRLGNAHPNIVPYQVFPCSDGHLIIACGNDTQFAALCAQKALRGCELPSAFPEAN